jgi:hypothetical protein
LPRWSNTAAKSASRSETLIDVASWGEISARSRPNDLAAIPARSHRASNAASTEAWADCKAESARS